MSCGAGGSLHFTSLILENLNNRAAFLCTPVVEKESYPPRTNPKAMQNQERGGGDVTISVDNPVLSSNIYEYSKQQAHFKHQLCASPWHKKSESMYSQALMYNSSFSHRCPGHEALLGIIVLSKFALSISYSQLSSRAEASKLFL